MALTKVSAAMFSTAAQTSDLNLDDGTLFVDSSENKVAIGNTTPAEALDITGNLTLRSRGYVKLQDASGGQFVALRAPATVSSNVTWSLPAADGSSGQSLVTDGSGALSWQTNYLSVSAGTGVTVSSNTISIGQAVGTSDSPTFTNLTLSGNLTVNGSTVTNSATNTTIEDLLIELGTGTSGSPSSDAGIVIERGSSDNVFMGWDESADVIVLGTGSFTGASSGNLTITPATLHVGSIGIGNAAPDVSLDIGSKTDAIHLPVGTTAQRPGSPAAGYFRYNSTLSKFEGYTTAWGEIGGGGSNSIVTDTFTGNGTTVDFTLSSAMSSVNNLIVFVDGVYQNPDAYSLPAATTLRFSAPPANSRKIVAYGITGVVTGSNLNIDSFTGDGSDLTFTLSIAPVNENNTLVYVGGVYQQKSVYSVSGTTLTFGSGNAPPNGASIEVATFNQTDINVPVDNTITTAKIVNDAVTADKIVDNIALPGNITTTGTLTPTGVLTANAGVVVDNITIDGTEIDLSSGDLIIDVAGDITLDAGGAEINFKDDTVLFGQFQKFSDNFNIKSTISDGDLVFQGNDGGSTINALILDMSDAGKATFNSGIVSTGGLFRAASSGATADASADDLVVENSANAGISILSGATSTGSIYFGDSGTNWDGYIAYSQNDRSMTLGTAAGGRVYIKSDGKVGIGVAAPDNLLHIKTTGSTPAIELEQDAGTSYKGLIKLAGNDLEIRGSSGVMEFYNGGNNDGDSATLRMTIDSSGNVGLNENTPTSYYSKTFQINGSGNTAAIKLTNTSTGNENGRGHDIASDGVDFRLVNREVGNTQIYTTNSIGSPLLAVDVGETGWVTLNRQPYFQANGSGGSWTSVTVENAWNSGVHNNSASFWSEGTDRGSGHFDPTNGRFTCPVTGWYTFTFSIYARNTNGSSGAYIHPQFFKNGVLNYQNGKNPYHIIQTCTTTNPEYLMVSITENIYCTATQYVEVKIYWRSQGTWEHYPNYAIFTGGLIS
tara:strand:- start:564 stop:3563 length:3000 start_codon:yes stop_codon:yes gene_type:complete